MSLPAGHVPERLTWTRSLLPVPPEAADPQAADPQAAGRSRPLNAGPPESPPWYPDRMQLPPQDSAPSQASPPPVYPVLPVHYHEAEHVSHEPPAPLAVAVWFLGLVVAIPVSCLPATWRTRTDPDSRLPLVAGTFLSALLLYLGALSFFGRALFTGQGWLVEHLHPGVFLLLGITSLFESGARMLHVLALRAPIGTLLLWTIERTLHLAHTAPRSWRRFRGHPDEIPLPRARVLP